ncbi:MAG: peroxiredoxin [Polyangiaceae bacterium]|nr:peroxiredoxin [Polyangiaceae bacterium]MCW5792155.1 peroxiredoxin [Polyangiaceae bacterium]
MRRLSLTALLSLPLLTLACDDASKGAPASAEPSQAASAAVKGPDDSKDSAEGKPQGTAEAPSGLLAVGADAPKVETVAHDGEPVSLEKLRGRPVVVYFYPKDDTKGCTLEAEQIRDKHEDLSKLGVVLGVSSDSNESHVEFAKKYSLPFKLLPDTDQAIANAFGVPVTRGYAKRVTFIIDKDGKVAKVFPDVAPDGHAEEIYAELKKLAG